MVPVRIDATKQEVYFQETDGMSLSPAELFGMCTRFLAQAIREGAVPAGAVCQHLDGPALSAGIEATGMSADSSAFAASITDVESFLAATDRMPDRVSLGHRDVAPGEYYLALAEAAAHLIERRVFPTEVSFIPAYNRVEQHVDEECARNGWAGSMLPDGFEAPELLQQARLQAWTLKPALLTGHVAE